MIDRWSVIHMVILILVGIIQVFMLKRLFNVKTGHQRINARA